MDNKVFFRCQQTKYSEICFDRDLSHDSHQTANASSSLPEVIPPEQPIQDYATILQYYTPRSLTYQGDALRAMAGLSRRVCLKTGCPILEGIPACAIDAFIVFKAGTYATTRRPGFPSYSWSGWQGGTTLTSHIDLTLWLRRSTWIIWYTKHSSGTPSFAWYPNASWYRLTEYAESYPAPRERNKFQPPEPLPFPTTWTAPTPDLTPSASLPPYLLLQFWTLGVYFKIVNLDMFRGTCQLEGLDGQAHGDLRLDGFDWTVFESDEPFELIVLSEMVHEIHSRHYNVMLLQWEGGLAERRGMGELLMAALGQSFSPGPVWKEILLG